MVLTAVSDLRRVRPLAGSAEIEAFEVDVLAGFVLARAAAGLADAEAVNLGLPVSSGVCGDGWVVDPGFAGWAGSDRLSLPESCGVFGERGVEDVLSLCHDIVVGAGVDVGGV